MNNKITNTASLPTGILQSDKLKAFFVSNLDRIYCAKSHLQKRLPEIRNHAHFTDLTHAVTETIVDVEKSISRMNAIYSLLDIQPGSDNCQGVIGIIEDAFSAIYRESKDPGMRDLSILFYLENIESIERSSFKMLNLVAPKLSKKEIQQLLKENFDEASEDQVLLQQIMANYLK